jgi:alkylation response protein AidB-like acyl-CoA dehydrogenase|tara:strand:+ start:1 stop:1203 length:1203 start_codon:yes stop_codon:yes gene_type:complete
MDFTRVYTPEQEIFRAEIKTWIAENVPENMKAPVDRDDLSAEQVAWWREKHKELAAKGWLYPVFPTEYGGGGLSGDEETIIEEEFAEGRVVKGFTNALVFPTLLVWATEDQKQKYLKPLLTAEKVAFQNFSEPGHGSDLASLESKATRDGDDWVINGQKTWVSGTGTADLLFGPLVTDQDAPRHRNLGYFLLPVDTDGIELKRLNLLNGDAQHFVFMDNARVDNDALIGGDHQGWQVTQTTLEQEHGGRGQASPRDDAMDDVLKYTRESNSDDIAKQLAVDSMIDSRITALFQERNFWMYETRQEMSYHGSLASMYNKEKGMRNADRAREIMGMYSLLDSNDPRAVNNGTAEVQQRGSLTAAHPGGTTEVQKVIIARRIGISRTQERAAPTPATATSYSS